MLLKQYSSGVEILSVDEDKLRKKIKEIVQEIKAEHTEVKEVILFGSFSKGDFTPYSDIDIAIVIDKTDKKFIERNDDFIDYFIDIPFDVNLVIYTSDEFLGFKRSKNKLIGEIIEGIRC